LFVILLLLSLLVVWFWLWFYSVNMLNVLCVNFIFHCKKIQLYKNTHYILRGKNTAFWNLQRNISVQDSGLCLDDSSSKKLMRLYHKERARTGCQWLKTVVLATEENEISMIMVPDQFSQKYLGDPISVEKSVHSGVCLSSQLWKGRQK
jgi:hypothetical protein